jgi:hypothetical protein
MHHQVSIKVVRRWSRQAAVVGPVLAHGLFEALHQHKILKLTRPGSGDSVLHSSQVVIDRSEIVLVQDWDRFWVRKV